MPKTKRRRFTRQFKEEAVRLLETDPRDGEEIARELGVRRVMLYRWRRDLGRQQKPINESKESRAALTADERAELRQLRKEVERLREEREILKKATAFFAKENK